MLAQDRREQFARENLPFGMAERQQREKWLLDRRQRRCINIRQLLLNLDGKRSGPSGIGRRLQQEMLLFRQRDDQIAIFFKPRNQPARQVGLHVRPLPDTIG